MQIDHCFPRSPFGVLDDEESIVADIGERQMRIGMPQRATTEEQECLNWIHNGEINSLLVDLRYKPALSGLDLISSVKGTDSGISFFVITAFTPDDKERLQAENLGVEIYQKGDQLEALLDRLQQNYEATYQGGSTSNISEKIRGLEQRIRILEQINKEWTADLVHSLERITAPESAVISGDSEPFTVAELIDDVKNFTPRGIEHIRLWRRLISTLIDLDFRKGKS